MAEPAALCQTDAMGRRVLAAWLAGTLTLSGCLSVRSTGSRTTEGGGGGGVALVVWADDEARRAGVAGPASVLGELDRHDGGRWVTIFRSINPAWVATGLPPGRYRVRLPARLDEAGNVVRLAESATEVRVAEGRITEVEAVLEHVDTGLVVAGVVAAVVAAVLISDYVSEHGLPKPPAPPPELIDLAFWVTIDLAAGGPWQAVADREPPVVTSHFPAANALVAARRPRLLFVFSERLAAGSLEPDTVTVLSETAGLIPCVVSYDDANWWVAVAPQQDLPPGDTLHVTLGPGAVEDASGNGLVAPASFAFLTAER
jgi:hypothetical protein